MSLTPPKLNHKDREKLKIAEIQGKAKLYLEISAKIKPLEAAKKKLASDLKEAIEVHGKREGNSVTVDDPNYTIAVVTPVSVVPDEVKAMAVLHQKGLVDVCTRRVIDPEAIQLAIQTGQLTVEDVESFTNKVPGATRISISEKA